MYKVWIISHNAFREHADVESIDKIAITVHENIEQHEAYMDLLEKAVQSDADLLVLHPPSTPETMVEDSLHYLRQRNSDHIRKVFITSRKDQVDRVLSDKFPIDRTIQVNETLFKKVFVPFIHRISALAETRRDVNRTLLEALNDAIRSADSRVAGLNESGLCPNAHIHRNIHGPWEFAALATDGGLLKEADVTALLDRLRSQQESKSDLRNIPVPLIETGHVGDSIPGSINRVLLIDDEHQRGWSTAFAAAIFGSTTGFTYSISPLPPKCGRNREFRVSHWSVDQEVEDAIVSSSSDLDEHSSLSKGLFAVGHSDNIVDDVTAFLTRPEIRPFQRKIIPFDLILLDFRLTERDNAEIPPSEVSGYRLAKAIHEMDPSIPMIVVSASDKVWTLLSMRSEGAWDYYLKPGPDDHLSVYTEQEYRRFIQRIEQASRFGWGRQIHSMSEWLSEKYRDTSDDDPRRRITETISFISNCLTEHSRLGVSGDDETGMSTRTLDLCFHLLLMCTESISSDREFFKFNLPKASSLDLTGLPISNPAAASIVKCYRNMVAHDSMPRCVPKHKHLMNFVTSLTALCADERAFPFLREDTPKLCCDDRCHNLERRFVNHFRECMKSDTFALKSMQVSISKLPSIRHYLNEKIQPYTMIRKISLILMGARTTTWLSLACNMFLLLHDSECKQIAESASIPRHVSFCAFIRSLYINTIEGLMKEPLNT